MKLSPTVLLELKQAFAKNKYPTKAELNELAQRSSESSLKIRNWFRAERKKHFDLGALKYEVI